MSNTRLNLVATFQCEIKFTIQFQYLRAVAMEQVMLNCKNVWPSSAFRYNKWALLRSAPFCLPKKGCARDTRNRERKLSFFPVDIEFRHTIDIGFT